MISTRSCELSSRWRSVTVSFSSGPFSPSVSKFTVTQNGVPASVLGQLILRQRNHLASRTVGPHRDAAIVQHARDDSAH